MKFAARFIGAFAVSLAALAGCNSLLGVQDLTQSETDAAVEIDAPPGTVTMRFVSVVRDFPTSGAIDVYVGDETTARITALRDVSEYVVVDPSTTKVSIRQQGQSGGAPLHEFTGLALTGDTKVTAVIAGVNASQSPDDRVRLMPLVENFAQAGTGQAQVRFVHAITDVTDLAIDVGLNNEAAPEFTGLTRFSATSAAGMAATAGQSLRIGAISGGTTFAAFAANGLELGKGCFVILSGQRAGAFGSNQAMTATSVCASRTPNVSTQGARIAVSHVVADGTTCSVTNETDGSTIIASLGLRQFATMWVLSGDEMFAGANLNCGGQSHELGIAPDIADVAPQYVAIGGGSISPVDLRATSFQRVTLPSTGSRHAYFSNLTANVGDCAIRIDGADVLGTVLPPGGTLGPDFGQPASVVAPGSHTIAVDDINDATTATFTVTGATGGATLFVLDGARVPAGSQRPWRLTPFDMSTFPPTVGTPIAPN